MGKGALIVMPGEGCGPQSTMIDFF